MDSGQGQGIIGVIDYGTASKNLTFMNRYSPAISNHFILWELNDP